MNMQKNIIAWCFSIFVPFTLTAKVVEFFENPYLMNAPQELVTKVETIADRINFTKNYEVIAPKKAGIQINPWNKFIAQGINPDTKNYMIIINPEWFLSLSNDEQDFLLIRSFETFTQGSTPSANKIITFIYALLSIALLIFLVILLQKSNALAGPKIIRIVISVAIVRVLEFCIFDRIEKRIKYNVAHQHDLRTNEMAAQKLGNYDAAVKALEFLDASIKQDVQNGQTAFIPYVNMFEGFAKALKN